MTASAGTLNFQVGANGDSNSRIAVDLSSANVSSVSSALTTGRYALTGAIDPATVAGTVTFTQGGVDVDVAMGAAHAQPHSRGDVASTLQR